MPRQGVSWSGAVRQGLDGLGRCGTARTGEDWLAKARPGRHDGAWRRWAGRG